MSKELGLYEIILGDKIDYIYPKIYKITRMKRRKIHGLSNSDIIIPFYYQLHKHLSKILSIDYFTMIKENIRNFIPLNKYQLAYYQNI